MDKFIKYLEKQGVQRADNHSKYDYNVCFEVRKCGDDSFFTEAPNFTYNVVTLFFEYNVEAGKEYFMYLDTLERKIRSYAKKYGYIVDSYSTYYGLRYFNIKKVEDAEKADNYFSFVEACRNQFDEVYHIMYEAGRKENGEKAARILNKIYSLRYRQFLRTTKA